MPHRLILALLLLTPFATAQSAAPAPVPQPQVLFERSTPAADSIITEPVAPAAKTLTPRPGTPAAAPPAAVPSPATASSVTGAAPSVTDAARSALRFTAYDLDARITPATAGLSMRARITVMNTGTAPLAYLSLQISSTLHWESATLLREPHDGQPAQATPLHLDQHLLDTDADHTGRANEAVLTLPTPLAPGASLTLDTFYSGTIAASAARLERIGATPVQAASADWDSLATSPSFGPAIRGFGNVLWYPVASPQLFLGEANQLFAGIAAMRAAEQTAMLRLHLAVFYQGEPPVAAYLCGRRQPLAASADNPDTPVATGSGVATADFSAQPIGFRLPSLFLIDHTETLLAALPLESGGDPSTKLLAVVAPDDHSLPLLQDSALAVAPLLVRWLGPHPVSALTVLDHQGQPFEDGPLLIAPVATLAASTSEGALIHSLTHAWVQTGEPWIDDGLAQFFALLWVEQQEGRPVALAQMTDLLKPLALAEPAFTATSITDLLSPPQPSPADLSQPLITATNELYYRRKSAAVFFQLRALVGDSVLQDALRGWLAQFPQHATTSPTDTARSQALVFEHLLETASHRDLSWFFADWVLRDRGLPDLTVVDVTPRQLPAGKGHSSGWLTAVTVRNDGAAAAEVPLTVRSGSFTVTRQLHISGLSSATDRIVTETAPTQVVVNDGTVPEVRVAVHTTDLTLKP